MKSSPCCLVGLLLLAASFQPIPARSEENKTTVSSKDLSAFMEKWGEYKPFRIPMEPEDEPLLLAALKKDPAGPWATYLFMKFADTVFEGQGLTTAKRPAHYKKALALLQPAHDILAHAVKAKPGNEEIQATFDGIDAQLAEALFEANVDVASAKKSAQAALAANKDPKGWNYGNTHFNSHTRLGRIALREGKVEEAKKHLREAGNTPGSPVLNSFGPDFNLASELAEAGEREAVIEFLDQVAVFWADPDKEADLGRKELPEAHRKQLNDWKEQLRAGKIPKDRRWR